MKHPVGCICLECELNTAEAKAWDSLGRYKFNMFGYWAAIWVHLNRIGGFKRPNPWKTLVLGARQRPGPETAPALADALENVEFVLRKHAESAVLIRDGDITKATIKPHCAIRKGSAAYEFARTALAQYAASFPEKETNLEPR